MTSEPNILSSLGGPHPMTDADHSVRPGRFHPTQAGPGGLLVPGARGALRGQCGSELRARRMVPQLPPSHFRELPVCPAQGQRQQKPTSRVRLCLGHSLGVPLGRGSPSTGVTFAQGARCLQSPGGTVRAQCTPDTGLRGVPARALLPTSPQPSWLPRGPGDRLWAQQLSPG